MLHTGVQEFCIQIKWQLIRVTLVLGSHALDMTSFGVNVFLLTLYSYSGSLSLFAHVKLKIQNYSLFLYHLIQNHKNFIITKENINLKKKNINFSLEYFLSIQTEVRIAKSPQNSYDLAPN